MHYKHKILVFGNPIIKKDSLPLKLIKKLRERFPYIEFKEFDPNENLENEGRTLNIIDTVETIEKVTLITDIEKIKTEKLYSMHDFDLGYTLKLLKKLNYIDDVKIFGIPMKIDKEKAIQQLTELITASLF
jgi:Ni,Fe-hydrogenase maturation factor